ncbi:DNA-binding protein SNT1 [Scheffersomyces stipitis CBS 6054]|uniref:DNA-binding protein SNT1 n=1 Tax=Scheffersomyces stipitis (strain ATCC 58785 / CBS 6054 / NBRC 10063 / NRRL Y-11545) TaxID=322104 RepID=A3GI02_PICST|nr:DNA-binding protein SNT1 [Scheffersomyces stipitis CBS 6054]EAZ63144.1 DNA-binding protein SNT1 [Scheffersomyces stipitis CBS 6054]
MSSSGSRGPPPNRYYERNEYNEYGRSRRKNFYSSNASSRRDYKSSGPGSSSLSHSKLNTNNEAIPPNASNNSGRSSFGTGPNVRDSRNNSSSYGNTNNPKTYGKHTGVSSNSPNSGQSSYTSYYPSYGKYGNFTSSSASANTTSPNADTSTGFYGSRSDSWRSDRIKSGDSRLSSSNKQVSSTYNSRFPSNSLAGNDYRKDKYDSSYAQAGPTDTSANLSGTNNLRWKSSNSVPTYNSNKVPIAGTRGSLSGSVGSRYSAKDRARGSFSSGGGSSALVNSGTKRSGDTYYPSGRNSYGSAANYGQLSKPQERFSSVKTSDRDYTKPRVSSIMKKESSDDYSPSPGFDIDTKSEIGKTDQDEQTEEEMKLEQNDMDEDDQDLDEEDDEDLQEENDDKSKIEIEIETKYEGDIRVAVEKTEVPEVVKIDVSNEICYPEGCKYPLTKIETEFELLEKEFEHKLEESGSLKYTLYQPIEDFNDYPFFSKAFKRFVLSRAALIDKLKTRNKAINRKRLTLWNDYKNGHDRWEVERKKMEQQLRLLHPPDDEMRREIDSSDNRKQFQRQFSSPENPADSAPGGAPNRRGRRHGDLVTTEAEFQEILKSLGEEQDEDPLIKAERVAAEIPELILDPVMRDDFKYMNSNNIVKDREGWTHRVKTDFVNNFSPTEHQLFCEGFCLYPKRFGAISRHMGGLRTASDCVIHYYITKKAVNYKQLLAQFKKKSTKKAGRRGKQGRSRNVSQTQTPVSTPIRDTASVSDESIDSRLAPPLSVTDSQAFSEELFTDTGRRKRAAAPVFDGKPKKPEATAIVEELSIENGVSTPPKKKQRKRKEDGVESVVTPQANGVVDRIGDETQKVDFPVPPSDLQSDSGMTDPESKERRRTISSYWSITEATMFPHLLNEHGTKWTTIADKLTTKTATMVRNYFQRNAEKNGWNKAARDADERLEAKFAAVLNPKADVEQRQYQAEQYQQQPLPQHIRVHEDPIIRQYIPMGTFQHAPPIQEPPLPTVRTHVAPLSNLLSSDTSSVPVSIKVEQQATVAPPYKAQVYQQPTLPIHHDKPALPPIFSRPQASIMSLLNSDSSPVKVEPVMKPPILPTPRKNSLNDLLNSPSSFPAYTPIGSNGNAPTVPKRNGIASLLSADADSTSSGNGGNSNQHP